MRRAPYFLAAFLLFPVLGLTGCKAKLDGEKLEKNIFEGIKEQVGITPKEVICPDDIAEKKGEFFECTAVAPNGEKAVVKVEMLGDGNVHWKLGDGAAPGGADTPAPGGDKAQPAPGGDNAQPEPGAEQAEPEQPAGGGM